MEPLKLTDVKFTRLLISPCKSYSNQVEIFSFDEVVN